MLVAVQPLSGCALSGVNLAGAEFGGNSIPGVFGTDYIYPLEEEVDYFVGKGMNVFRIPFRWERLQVGIVVGGALIVYCFCVCGLWSSCHAATVVSHMWAFRRLKRYQAIVSDSVRQYIHSA